LSSHGIEKQQHTAMGGSACSFCIKRDLGDEKKLAPQTPRTEDDTALVQDSQFLQQLNPEEKEEVEKTTKHWAVHVGVVTFGSDGVEVKPQMKVGAETDNFSTEVGVSDIRDGIKVGAVAQVMADARAEGNSVLELHQNIECDTVGFKQALEVAKSILSTGKEKASELTKIAEVLGMGLASLEKILGRREAESANNENVDGAAGGGDNADPARFQLRVEGSVGLGVSAEVRLGWADTRGYKMIGCGGNASAGAGIGADVFAGTHEAGTSAMIILGIGNFTFEYAFPLGKKESMFAKE